MAHQESAAYMNLECFGTVGSWNLEGANDQRFNESDLKVQEFDDLKVCNSDDLVVSFDFSWDLRAVTLRKSTIL